MDDLRNRGPHPHPHHHHGFPRMANWMSAGDADDGGMADLASRMAHSNWPLSSSRRGGAPWRERRGSGGSAMSATSEDDSSYDAALNDKSSQGSGGSGGLDAVSHEIPIMIEAEAPPSMMPQQQQQQSYSNHSDHHQQQHPQQQHPQQQVPSGPELPLVGQLRKSPQYATRTSSACEGGNPPEQLRATRCASAPPQMLDQAGGDGGGGGGMVGSASNNRFVTRATVTPQVRSATVPISPHNNVAKPFVATYKSAGTPRGQDPIMEESPQQQQQPHQQQYPANAQQQEQYPQQEYYQPQQQQQHPQQQWSNQPYYHQQQPHQYPGYDDPWQQYYANDPRSFEEDQYYEQQQQPHLQHQRPSVVRNIPIFIEGQNSPIINEDKPSFSSSPRSVPPVRAEHQQQQPQQQQHFQQDPNFNQQQQFYKNSPPTFGNVSYKPQQQYQPNQQYYQQQKHPQPTQQQQHDYQPQQQQNSPQQKQHYQPQPRQQKPVPQQQQQQQQQDHTLHEIPIQHEQPPPQRQPSPQPQPPPVKLTPLQRIDQVRANSEEFMKRVDEFRGTKKDRDFLYLDEMLTRALISLDDIDPDGNDEIRQARKALVRDINAKLSLLEKTVSAAMSSNATEGVEKAQAICENGETVSPENKKEVEVTAQDETIRNLQPESQALEEKSCVTQEPKPNVDTKAEPLKSEVQSGEAESSQTPAVQTDDCTGPVKVAIPCPAPAIPLPEK